MKKFILLFAVIFSMAACTNSQKQKNVSEKSAELVVMSVDELLASAKDLVDQEVLVKGTVSHVCKHSGARCFLMGSNEEMTIRVEAGEEIGAFTQEQLGSELEVVGILKEVMVGEATHDEHAHTMGEAEEDHAEDDHKMQEADAEPVYFIEGLKVKELSPAPEEIVTDSIEEIEVDTTEEIVE